MKEEFRNMLIAESNKWCLDNYKKFGITKEEAKNIFEEVLK